MGLVTETEYLLLLSKELTYLDISSFEKLNSGINIIKQKIYSLKQKLK
jgi:hypothetical protein